MSRGVDFNNQFDFSNTHAPYLLDQRHRVSIAATYAPALGAHLQSGLLRAALSDWTLSTTMQFASGRPYAALVDVSCAALALSSDGTCPDGSIQNPINNTAALQSTANSALGINAGSPSPAAGLDSFYGPWTQQIDLGLTRKFHITERNAVSLQAQVFNVANHANYYVQNGTGVAATQYSPFGANCGDGASSNQQCYLVPNDNFGTLQIINYQNGPRIMQFSVKWTF